MREIRFLLNLRWLCSYRPAWIHNYKTCCCTVGITLECANNKNKPFSLYWWGHSGHTHIDRDTPRCFPSTCESTGLPSFLCTFPPDTFTCIHDHFLSHGDHPLHVPCVFMCVQASLPFSPTHRNVGSVRGSPAWRRGDPRPYICTAAINHSLPSLHPASLQPPCFCNRQRNPSLN